MWWREADRTTWLIIPLKIRLPIAAAVRRHRSSFVIASMKSESIMALPIWEMPRILSREKERGIGLGCSTMGWEQRGNKCYYYKKQREGSRVKSIYVGRGEIAHMISQIQSSSFVLERLVRTVRSAEVVEQEKAEARALQF